MMQHADDQPTAINATKLSEQQQRQQQHPSAMVPDTVSPSSTSSPKSLKASLEPNISQTSETTLSNVTTHELTPPSSVASSQEQHGSDVHLGEVTHLGGISAPLSVTGKKRMANGLVKETVPPVHTHTVSNTLGHNRNTSNVSQISNTSLGELSQQLKTKLKYAMLKVQNGWQKHSLDEIESIASQSPYSSLSGFAPREHHPIVSPRTALAAGMRHNSESSSSSNQSARNYPGLPPTPAISINATETRKALAPPAPIVPGNRRRPTPNVRLQINNSLRSPHKPIRPPPTQRTPSQNAAMEADAVETLLFMSTSPSNSGHFPSHLSAYSPTSQSFSAQTSPLKAHFNVNDQRIGTGGTHYSPQSSNRRSRYEDKAALIDRLLNDLDEEESEELDRAVKIMERHHAAKLSA